MCTCFFPLFLFCFEKRPLRVRSVCRFFPFSRFYLFFRKALPKSRKFFPLYGMFFHFQKTACSRFLRMPSLPYRRYKRYRNQMRGKCCARSYLFFARLRRTSKAKTLRLKYILKQKIFFSFVFLPKEGIFYAYPFKLFHNRVITYKKQNRSRRTVDKIKRCPRCKNRKNRL